MAVNQVLKEISSSPKKFSFDSFEEQDRLIGTDTDEEDIFLVLREAALAVFRGDTIEESLEALCRHVEYMDSYGARVVVYNTLDSLITTFAKEQIPFFTNDDNDPRKASASWGRFCERMLLVRNIFLQMDQEICQEQLAMQPIWDMGLSLFRKLVAMHDNIQTIYADKIVELIAAERQGTAIDRSILKSLCSMFIDLNLYVSYLEPRFLRETERYYNLEGVQRASKMDISSYLHYINLRIKEEESIVTLYLNRSTKKSVTFVLNEGLIIKQMAFLFSALDVLIENENWNDLSLLYSLLSRVSDGVERLREEFKKAILAIGTEIVQNPQRLPEKDKELIPRLIKLKGTLDACVKESFQSDASCKRIINEAFEEFINQRPNYPAELLAKYMDLNLRGNKRIKSDANFDMELDDLMQIFRYINGKDVFKAFYECYLCKRLICGRSASVDSERSILFRLKNECGPDYTLAMEQMFRDVELSEELSDLFRRNRPHAYPIDFTIYVLAPASSYRVLKAEIIYPPEMITIKQDFEEFFKVQRKGKKLTYIPYLGSCIVKAQFPETPSMPKELQVSEFQTLILLLFNDVDDEGISYARIAAATGIPKEDLDRALISFTASKQQRVLISKPLTVDLKDDTMFFFNKRFKHNLTRIRFNQIQLKETRREHEATEASIVTDRAAHVDCMIVRIMKMRKSIEHSVLINEVMGQIKFPYKSVDIKKRIEMLISREFISRDPSQPNRYHYVA